MRTNLVDEPFKNTDKELIIHRIIIIGIQKELRTLCTGAHHAWTFLGSQLASWLATVASSS